MVRIRVLVRPKQSASMPKTIPPMAQPIRKTEKMIPPYHPISSAGTVPVASAGGEQLMQRRMQDDGIDRGIHRIEYPAKPGDKEYEPLIARHAMCPG